MQRRLAAIVSADVQGYSRLMGEAIQGALKTHNEPLPVHRRMEFRIGINLGDVIAEEERIYGDGVNIAARVENARPPPSLDDGRR